MMLNQAGLIKCAHYAFAPNQLHYCGPEKQPEMLEYVSTHAADPGLVGILSRFDTLYKYLILIARENRITDPFDPRVVEAYWLGNELLNAARLRPFARHLEEELYLKKKIPAKHYSRLMDKLDTGFPNHTFHVLNVFLRTGHLGVPHTLSTMDNCRIGWGQVVRKRKLDEEDEHVVYVDTSVLAYEKNKIILGKPVIKRLLNLHNDLTTGDWLTYHWEVVCEKITPRQKKNLERHTLHALRLANRQVNTTPILFG